MFSVRTIGRNSRSTTLSTQLGVDAESLEQSFEPAATVLDPLRDCKLRVAFGR